MTSKHLKQNTNRRGLASLLPFPGVKLNGSAERHNLRGKESTMSLLSRIADATASMFCHHEWTSRHEPNRWYLECVKCGNTTHGIEVGRTATESATVYARREAHVLTVLKPTSSRAA
jgi:hypothetical protein